MSHEVAVRGVVIASWGALGAAVTLAVQRGARARRQLIRAPDAGDASSGDKFAVALGGPFDGDYSAELAADVHGALNPDLSRDVCIDLVAELDAELAAELGTGPGQVDGARFDDRSRSALAACLFAAVPDDHIWWTILVVDPALLDTPSHLRLVGHFEAEFAAVDAADHLARELNSCLVPGEALLTATAIGIEPEARTADDTDDGHSAAPWLRRRGPVARTESVSFHGTPLGDVSPRRP